MSVGFTETGHRYFLLDGTETELISVTTLIHALCPPFTSTPEKCSVRKPGRFPNKWYGLPPKEIQDAWDAENKRSTDLGRWYHTRQEDSWIQSGQATICDWKEGIKYSLSQKLTTGVYIEFLVYLESAGLTGQVDKIEIRSDILDLTDYKTNKEIKRVGFKNWEGVTKKMLPPLQHLDDCEYNYYSLQLSLYAFILLRHNPNLTLGNMTIEHVQFEIDGEDKYQYPIVRRDENGDPVIKQVNNIEVPYMKSECIKLIEWVRNPDNRNSIKKH